MIFNMVKKGKVFMKRAKMRLIFMVSLFICLVGCASSEKGDAQMKPLKIKWQRLISQGETCPRCGSTEKEVDMAVSKLRQSLAPLGFEVRLETTALSVSEFKKDPLQSNQIWIDNRPLESWVEGRIDKSPCSGACGALECRTLEVNGKAYETIPADIIIQAGLLAAIEILKNEPIRASCGCNSKIKSSRVKSCCPQGNI
jgi:hypothetical protein